MVVHILEIQISLFGVDFSLFFAVDCTCVCVCVYVCVCELYRWLSVKEN